MNDEYFGKIPADRLIKENGIIYFKIDGLYRSKLGLPASRATDICGSYDSSKGVLTILWCSLPETPSVYVLSLIHIYPQMITFRMMSIKSDNQISQTLTIRELAKHQR